MTSRFLPGHGRWKSRAEEEELTDLETLRPALVLLLGFTMLGTIVELLLLGHTESVWQWIPIVLLSVGVAAVMVFFFRPSLNVVRGYRALMVLFVMSGPVGLYQHYTGNEEFELEMYPTRKGLELVWESLTGATPALAPGMMIYLGLLGLATAYGHPATQRPETSDNKEKFS
jgi:hypothetical protein